MSRAWVEVDLGALAHNVGRLRASAPGAELCAVVKADAYGHGAVAVSRAVLDAGATRLAVAQVDEGVALRRAGIEAPIWVLAEPEPDELPAARRHRLEPAVYSTRGIDAALATTGEHDLVLHLKVDTGMHRVGAHPDDVVDLARRIVTGPGTRLGSVWTHCAVADEPGRPETAQQLRRYDDALGRLASAGIRPPLTHAANTAGALAHPAARRDVVRCGIGLHGIAPGPGVAGLGDLRPTLSWRTRVGFVKRVPAGTAVSYGLHGVVDRAATLATLPVGYADGLDRARWRGGEVLVGGRRRRIVGVVTMDQVVVDCGDDDVRPGDEAVLLGTQGEERITVEEWAEQVGTIGYEVVCGIGARVERRYVRGPA